MRRRIANRPGLPRKRADARQAPVAPVARAVSTVVQRPCWDAWRSTILPPGGMAVPSIRRRPEKRTVPAPRSVAVDAWIVELAGTRSDTLRVRVRRPAPPG